jgi:uncharacterized membrane protein YidH (DUF202 family)
MGRPRQSTTTRSGRLQQAASTTLNEWLDGPLASSASGRPACCIPARRRPPGDPVSPGRTGRPRANRRGLGSGDCAPTSSRLTGGRNRCARSPRAPGDAMSSHERHTGLANTSSDVFPVHFSSHGHHRRTPHAAPEQPPAANQSAPERLVRALAGRGSVGPPDVLALRRATSVASHDRRCCRPRHARAFLAWNRTALALVAAGLAATSLLPELNVPGGRRLLGVPLILLGATLAALSYRRWDANERACDFANRCPPRTSAPFSPPASRSPPSSQRSSRCSDPRTDSMTPHDAHHQPTLRPRRSRPRR